MADFPTVKAYQDRVKEVLDLTDENDRLKDELRETKEKLAACIRNGGTWTEPVPAPVGE